MKEVMKHFFPTLFPPQAILNTFITVCDTLLKKIVLWRKNSVSSGLQTIKRLNTKLAMIRNFPSEIFSTGKLQFFQKISISSQENQNEGSLPRLLSSTLFSHSWEQGNWWELCRLPLGWSYMTRTGNSAVFSLPWGQLKEGGKSDCFPSRKLFRGQQSHFLCRGKD